ncbi:alpha/beta hydrolase family protein [Paludibaculum fermentans]|uniref:Acetylxylan esterase n=1 Tax=Paludibaculum fermentans TaxID=1473598 RepID=A0A7S7NNH3_PALFE|nr:acetylxylan esterase [Paludibaculum fermentans]QOY86868.1 acetylxylan esterase [Paludibaculum fermentans]
MTPISRRAILTWPSLAWAQPPAAAQSSLALHLAAQLDNLAIEWDARRAAITTPAAFQNRIRFIQARVREMLGPLGPATPLHAEVTRITQRDGYRIENLLFQSAPNLWVTANLYVPASPGPHPAVLSPCGHYEISRQHPDYQRAYILLARAGFVVLAYDPTGQGERRQYWDPVTKTQQGMLRSVDEHSLSGHLLLLLGQSLTGYLVRDGMRGIDYLLSRPDVDPQRIACAGHSGGGTLTMFLAHADPRIRCFVINEGGTFHRWPMHLQPGAKVPIADAEQNLFPAAIHGIDACDLHSAIAPRPLLALIENYTPAFQETAAHIRRRYSLLGHDADFETAEAQAPHAWTQKLRLATADFLSRHLLQKPGPTEEPPANPEPPDVLNVTPSGSLKHEQRGLTLFQFVQREVHKHQPVTSAALRQFLRLPAQPKPEPRRIHGETIHNIRVETYDLPIDSTLALKATAYHPASPSREAPIVLIGDQPHVMNAELASQGRRILAVDVRGLTGPPSANFSHLFAPETAHAYLAWYLNQDLCGLRVADTLQSIASARLIFKTTSVVLESRGLAGVWALCAAAIEPAISATTCLTPLLSYAALTRTDRHLVPASYLVRGLLQLADLPEIAALIAPRRLTIAAPVDAMLQPIPLNEAIAEYRPTRDAYRRVGHAGRFTLAAGPLPSA